MVFNIENAVLNIANGSAVRSGLNVDLEYYSQNNVNIVIMLTSDGEEYLPSSTLEEAQKMAYAAPFSQVRSSGACSKIVKHLQALQKYLFPQFHPQLIS